MLSSSRSNKHKRTERRRSPLQRAGAFFCARLRPTPEPKPELTEEEKEKARLSKSIQRFIKEYPDVKATDVPPEVWKDYREHRADLLECYQLYENKKLKDEIKSLKQNQKNKERSTGSKKSAGKKTVDKWFDGWPDD